MAFPLGGPPPSASAVLLGALALCATASSPRGVAAADDARIAGGSDRRGGSGSSRRRRHLRRGAAADGSPDWRSSPSGRKPGGSKSIDSTAASIVERVDGVRRRTNSCLWYPDHENPGWCTNDENIPDLWRGMEEMMLPTSDACCLAFFDGHECSVRDVGCGADDPSSAPAGPECVGHGWHVDLSTKDGCTDDDNYSEEWLVSDVTKSFMFLATPEECCSRHFSDRECVVRHSGCGGGGDTESCITPGWYADPVRRDGCTNGDNYEEEWLQPEMKDMMFHPTPQACCDTFFGAGRPCATHDEGCAIEGEGSNGCGGEWHPDAVTKDGCSNDDDYPPEWKSEADMLFSTPEDCCQVYHRPDLTCQVRDACKSNAIADISITLSPTGTPPRRCAWHPSVEQSGSPRCDYSDTYPLEWLEPANAPDRIFGSHELCCKVAHGRNSCGKAVAETCGTLAPSPSPTDGSTETPTESPTPKPSSSPTSVYYIHHFHQICVRASEVPKPYYITQTFIDYDVCCQFSPKKELCLDKGPTDAPTSWWPTMSPGPTTMEPTALVLYYVDHQTGICKGGTRESTPYYITEMFIDYWECCKSSFEEELCLKEGPTRDPTGRPTEEAVPSSQPSEALSTLPSSQPTEPHPTGSPTKYHWGALRAFSSKPTFRPTKRDCSDSFWHVDTESPTQGCTNYNIDPTLSATLLFQTAEICCRHFFEGLECMVRDSCKLTDGLISAMMNYPWPEDLCDNWWHPDILEGRDGCSNHRYIPESWRLPKNKSYLIFDRLQDCCETHYTGNGNHCKVYDYCATQTDIPTRHPTPRPILLSKSPTKPPMKQPTKQPIKHPTYQPSSEAVSPQLPSPLSGSPSTLSTVATTATVNDDTTHPETSGETCFAAKWHMTLDMTKCSNNFEYHSSWPLFNNSSECCVDVFGYLDCDIEDICLPEATSTNTNTHNQTQELMADQSRGPPTPGSTLRPTQQPTTKLYIGTQTPGPTPSPTQQPTATLQKIGAKDDSNGRCSGKNKKQCFNNPECRYERTGRMCVAMETTSHLVSKPTTSTTKLIPDATITCNGKLRKKCNKDPECTWVTSENFCAKTQTLGDGHENETGDTGMTTAATTKAEEITTKTTVSTKSTPSDSQNCDKRRWHPKTITDRTCSNSHDYPSLWDNHPYSEQFLFRTFKQCCKKYYGGACKIEDVC